MQCNNGELERLLPETIKSLPRIPSNRFQDAMMPVRKDSRFQVSRTEGEEEQHALLDVVPRTKGSSEPPVTPTTPVERKISQSTGRFTVNGPEIPEQEAQVEVEEEDPPNDDRQGRTVHFSVGDRGEEGRRSTEGEGNATINLKSWRNMKTLEHPPIIDFYRQSIDQDGIVNARPSMSQLIHGQKSIPEDDEFEDFKVHADEILDGQVGPSHAGKQIFEKWAPPASATRVKFGWIQGVFVRCLLNIFGVMLYLRVSWVAGQAGIGLGCAIVLLASLVTSITALSTCAICTNGDVKGGGAYFLISRSLGPEFGGSIGLIFSVANAVAAAMYIVGFAETIRDILRDAEMMPLMPLDELNMIRAVGIVTCVILMGIVFIGTAFESKMQLGLLAILSMSIVNYAIGSLFPPTLEQQLKGSTGYSLLTLKSNLLPDFRDGEHFFSVFSVYFPAATGIMAGANISGDLADPQRAIPIGTLLAIFVTTIVYLAVVIMTGSTTVRDANGQFPPVFDSNGLFVPPNCTLPPESNSCPYGLMNYFQVLEMSSYWGPLILAGIFAATLSSALASLVSAPKVFQAVCKDRLFPKIDIFAKGYGKNEEPRRAYALAFIIALLMIMIGDLNAIAPIISNFFLASYALINYACFDQSFADSPGFRPSFKYYNMWVSLMGSILCIIVMFVVSWSTALITFFFFAMLFLYILHRKPDVNWGSSTQAHSYKNALSSMVKLWNTEEHVKNYRPQLLVLCGNPAARPSLVDFVYNITKGSSLMICGYVVPYAPCDRVFAVCRKLDRQLNEWLKKRRVKSFYTSVANPSLRAGVQSLLQVGGLGKLRPNIVILGFKSNWCEGETTLEKLEEINDYFGVIQDSFENNMGVGVLRNSLLGLDFSDAMKKYNLKESARCQLPQVSKEPTLIPRQQSDIPLAIPIDEVKTSDTDLEGTAAKADEEHASSSSSFASNFPFDFDLDSSSEEGEPEEEVQAPEEGTSKTSNYFSLNRRRSSRRPTQEQKALLNSISRFQRKVKKGVIDVWWLYDDGGVSLLIPHLLTVPKSYLEGAKLRVFTISMSSKTMDQEQRGMAALLSKFRIDFSDVFVIPDVGRKPSQRMLDQFSQLISPFMAPDGEAPPGMITPSELSSQREKTNRQLRIGELLQEHSCDADLVVVTLPVPRKGLVSACLYLAWLDIMTRGLPPSLLIRGNQTSVLTFYS